MKSKLNVLNDYPYSKHYYITHPWKFFAHMWDNWRAAWHRITKGYCASDIWDFDHYLTTLLPAMLRELADNSIGYPGVEPFETPEKWKDWLLGMADKLELLQEDWAETRNEYEELYFHALDLHRKADPSTATYDTYNDEDIEKLRKKWLARINELNYEQQAFTIKTFEELGRYLRLLWM